MIGGVWSLPAEREFHQAVWWYAVERPGVDQEFDAAVRGAIENVIEFPDRGSPYLYGTRKMVLQRFPYSVIYLPHGGTTCILAVAHNRRRPGYWRKRLKSFR